MHCPRCGTEAREGDRFCRDCGGELTPPRKADAAGGPGRLRRLVGRTRKERLVTGATVAAILIAIGAVIALEPSEDTSRADETFLNDADERCVAAKGAIAGATDAAATSGDLRPYAATLVLATSEWWADLRDLPPPQDAEVSAAASRLEAALLDEIAAAGDFAAAVRGGERRQIEARAAEVDESAGEIEAAIDELGLVDCGAVAIAPRPGG